MYSYSETDASSQIINPNAATGAKYFGTSLAAQSVNPNVNKNATTYKFAIAAGVVAFGLFLYFRRR